MTTLAGKPIGPLGYGLMGLTLRIPSQRAPYESLFAAMKAALEAGANNWNGGEIYGPPDYNSLQLLAAYFEKYPEDADKVVISIKGGNEVGGIPAMAPSNGSPENIRRSIDECLRVLDGKKFLDVFEIARVDDTRDFDTALKTIDEYVQAGKIGAISLSEVNADTIRKAAKVVKVAAVEVEFSLFTLDILENGIASTCAELDIPIIAYSPLSRGFLAGAFKTPDDIPEGDFRRHFPRFQGEAFYKNLELVDDIEKIAKRNNATKAQIAIAWVAAQSKRNGNPVIIPIPSASTKERAEENFGAAKIKLSESDLKEIDQWLATFTVAGHRYPAIMHDTLNK